MHAGDSSVVPRIALSAEKARAFPRETRAVRLNRRDTI
jgi:hypothetical protein